MGLRIYRVGALSVKYRESTSDENVLREVLERKEYRRPSIGFDVEEGERWLDLGANIGAFAIYCKLRRAIAECYEPEPACYRILKKNAKGFRCVNAAVSNQPTGEVKFWMSNRKGNMYRGTLLERERAMLPADAVSNIFAGELEGVYDGVKMDIEGSEFGILDDDLLPICRKLCFEYHTSRDSNMARMRRRIRRLKKKFRIVSYVPELDRIMALGGEQKSFHDRLVFCVNPK